MAEVNQIQNHKDILNVEDYTPVGAVVAGTPLEVGGRAAFANNDIAAGELGSIQTSGLVKVVQKAETWAKDDDIWWDADGDPVGGVAGSGAATNVIQTAAADFVLGSARLVTAATDGQGVVDLNGKIKAAVVAVPTDLAESIVAITAMLLALEANGIMDNK